MKPPAFEYHDPRELAEACRLLATLDNAKILAGGQSLVPMLNMRFVFPDHLVDLGRVAELAFVREEQGRLHIGAMTRQRELERSALVAERCPLMGEALGQIGHRQTRNRGTIGGSLCHLDPAAELPVVALTHDAIVHVRNATGSRSIPMRDFPAFYMTPAIEPDEIVTSIELEPWPAGHGHAFVEYARRRGDFAIVSAAALVTVARDGAIERARVSLGGVAAGPMRCEAIESAVTGTRGDPAVHAEASAACRDIDAMEDAQVTRAYRRHLAEVLVTRALDKAYARAASAAGTASSETR